MLGHTSVLLLGTIGDRGVTVSPTDSGAMVATCRLEVPEAGRDGQTYTLYVPLRAYGKTCEALQACAAGE